ncbi:hypothetical protein [Luteipulveratus halotolerans]|uniref:hypothetical protein n=1 Tax=Luteipulveratus halotolerans TaxID=1631356 RepID=UPI0018D122FE|nr:hypothetical protein [Luteipulveratus halotolerans]
MNRVIVSSPSSEDDVNDPDLDDEIELVAVLVAAARRSVGRLSLSEIDQLLGIRPQH